MESKYDYNGPPAVISSQHRLLSLIAQNADMLNDDEKHIVKKIKHKLCTLQGFLQQETYDLQHIALTHPIIEKEVGRVA